MAEKSPDSAKSEAVLNPAFGTRGPRLAGLKAMRLPYITENVDDGDTYTHAGGAVAAAAWEPEDATDEVAVVLASNVVTFNCAAENATGYLWVFVSE